jgi:hypothetical protein
LEPRNILAEEAVLLVALAAGTAMILLLPIRRRRRLQGLPRSCWDVTSNENNWTLMDDSSWDEFSFFGARRMVLMRDPWGFYIIL